MAQLKKDSSGNNSSYWNVHGDINHDFKNETELEGDLEGVGICSTVFSNRLEEDRRKNQQLLDEILEVKLDGQAPNSQNDVPLQCINLKDWGTWEWEKQSLKRSSCEC